MKRWGDVCGVRPWLYADELAVMKFGYVLRHAL